MENKDIFLESASKIGIRLIQKAMWHNNECTWMIKTADRDNREKRETISDTAGSAIYNGTSGIAYFLRELFNQTEDVRFKNHSIGALLFAIEREKKNPTSLYSLFSGQLGVAYSLIKAGIDFEREDFIQTGKAFIRNIQGKEYNDTGLDIIGGSAGAIPILTKLYAIFEEDWLFDIALNLGENLIKKARLETVGWSWGKSNSNIRNLCGFGHGASGIGHAFLELYSVTDSDYHLFVAEQAFNYERQFFNETKGNWPDLRHREIGEYIYDRKIGKLRELLKNEQLPPWELGYMSAWCHGAPGIGLSRLRAFELTSKEIYREELLAAIRNTLESFHLDNNYSLCHGIFGNCELLLNASTILNNAEYFQICGTIALKGIERYAKQNLNWPGGLFNAVNDVSFMLGDAGIGYFLLRIYNKSVESLLCPCTNSSKTNVALDLNILKEKYIDEYYKLTGQGCINANKNFSHKNWISSIKVSNEKFRIELIKQELDNLIESEIFNENEVIKEIKSFEDQIFEESKRITDFTKEYCNMLQRDNIDSINWEESYFTLEPTVKLYVSKYNWLSLLEIENLSQDESNDDGKFWITFRNENKIKFHKINYLTYIILKGLKVHNIAGILEYLHDRIHITPEFEDNLKNFIKKQLRVAYQQGIVTLN